jgi:SAM-dependent methyltransferase
VQGRDVVTSQADAAAIAYDAFAPFYDVFTAHQDYAWWWSELLPLVAAAGASGTRVLDVACGTGKSLEPLIARGWSAVGVDVSAGMLAEARRKLGSHVPLHQHDMRELPTLGEFDLVCALNDAVNYVRDERELLETLLSFRRNLAAGGVAVFDVNTIATFRQFGALVHQQPDRIVLVEAKGGDDFQQGDLLVEDFVLLERRDGFVWSCERSTHYQRHHSDAELRRSLRAAGLELVDVCGMRGRHVEHTLDEHRDEKAIYVARATARSRET